MGYGKLISSGKDIIIDLFDADGSGTTGKHLSSQGEISLQPVKQHYERF